jgi:hypothetical protein
MLNAVSRKRDGRAVVAREDEVRREFALGMEQALNNPSLKVKMARDFFKFGGRFKLRVGGFVEFRELRWKEIVCVHVKLLSAPKSRFLAALGMTRN